jgi:uncharacterized protein GlcG (DUF336 family)
MDLLTFAKNIADRVETQSARAKVPVAVCVMDIHGNIILKHRMSGAPAFSIELSERKAYTSALVGLRTADLSSLVQPGQELFPLMGLSGGRFCSMGSGAPLTTGANWSRASASAAAPLRRTSISLNRRCGKPSGLPSPQHRKVSTSCFHGHPQRRTRNRSSVPPRRWT